MAKSYAKQLADTFVKATVREIGRNGGKVISNKLYGDAHSTPQRIMIQNNQAVYEDGTHVSKEVMEQALNDAREEMAANGEKRSKIGKCNGVGTFIFMFIIGAIPLLGMLTSLYYIIWAIPSLKGYTFIKSKSYQTMTVADGRYRGGYRVVGGGEVTELLKFPALNREEKLKNIGLGLFYLIMAFVFVAIRLYLIYLTGVLSE